MRGGVIVALIGLLLALASLPLWSMPAVLAFREVTVALISRHLALLMVVALFFERSLEIFISTLRGPTVERKELKLRFLRQDLERLGTPCPNETEGERETAKVKIETLQAELIELEQERAAYRTRTRSWAMWSGLLGGVLLSVAGLRTLQNLADPGSFAAIPEQQQHLLRVMDVFLTGGLIAGGSEGIHQITQVFKNYLGTSAANAKRARQDK